MTAKPMIVPALIVSVTLVVMSGACSQHAPGSYEGGGRSTMAPQLTTGTTEDSGGTDDGGFDFDAFDFDALDLDGGQG